MKKKLLFLMTLLAVSLFVIAEETVYVYKKDGTKASYLASELDSIGFVDIDSKGYEYVDLGLPSGLLWATCNLGAEIPTQAGRNFAWGDVIPGRGGSESSYIWYKTNKYTKYNDTDQKKVLDLEDDAANVYMGGDWRLPTSVDFKELLGNCQYDFTTTGIVFTSKINNKQIIFPAFSTSTSNSYSLWLGDRSGSKANSILFEKYNSNYVSEISTTGGIRYNLHYIRPVLPRSNSFVIYFSANGGEGHIVMNANHGDNLTLPTNTFIRDGYEFICWIDEDRNTYSEGETIVVLDEKKFYAQWIKIPKEVETTEGFIDLGLPSGTKWAICNIGASSPEVNGTIGGSPNKDSRFPTLDEAQELVDNCTQTLCNINGVECYVFTSKINNSNIILPKGLRYYTSTRGYDPSLNYTKYYYLTSTAGREYSTELSAYDEQTYFRAVKRDKFTLTFDANAGVGVIEGIEKEYAEVISIPQNVFVREGYYFSGWNTEADGTGTSYADKSEVTLKSNITLYAQWRPAEVSGIENGYEWVDLGLPSGTRWATCNIGATSPEGYGEYYAWGETVSKSSYSQSDYKWYINGSSRNIKKYNYSYSTGMLKDSIYVLEKEDDVAFINWGGDWRMPTIAELDELRDTSYTTWIWTTQNGVNGYKVTSKINGNSIFLPAAGYRNYSGLSSAGSGGYYWSSSLSTSDSYDAYLLIFYSSSVYSGSRNRDYGLSIRPVLKK